MPVGIGYDVHRFGPGRRLVLCGVEFLGSEGLVGHSDADVAAHAIMDALLGAAALGDIGQHFPPSDDRYASANSLDLLRGVVRMLEVSGWIPGNVDVTIIAERPRVGPRVDDMKARVGAAIGLDPSRVGVKATTNEGLGFLGRGEGIAAIAVAEILPRLPGDARAVPSVGSIERE
jgi:2-C-methyl-D-erythritol 2,4-cyclodiphosphate synthase